MELRSKAQMMTKYDYPTGRYAISQTALSLICITSKAAPWPKRISVREVHLLLSDLQPESYCTHARAAHQLRFECSEHIRYYGSARRSQTPREQSAFCLRLRHLPLW